MAAIPPYVLDGDVIDPDDWGNPVVDALTDHESRLDVLDAATLPTRVTAAEGSITALQADVAAVGTRCGHVYTGGQIIYPGDAAQYNTENYRSSIDVNGTRTAWIVQSDKAGIYSISWSLYSPSVISYLDINGTNRMPAAPIGGDSYTFGTWTGYLSAASVIKIIYSGGAPQPHLGGGLDIWRVAQGG